MSPNVETTQQGSLASYVLADAWMDFMLSRQATRSTPATLAWYQFTVGMFLKWADGQGMTQPDQIGARLVGAYIAEEKRARNGYCLFRPKHYVDQTNGRLWLSTDA